MFFIETLVGELKPVVMGDKGGWVWMSRKIIDEIYLEIVDYRDSDATNKINHFSWSQYCSASVMFFTEFIMEEIELVVAEEYKFENWAK